MKLVVGLGNPGLKYKNSRHNAGFMILERFADLHDISINQSLLNAEVGKGRINGEMAILAQPQTFMNLSGFSVRRLADYFRIAVADLIVLHDDLDLPFQTIRLKYGGGNGGHKGLLSLMQHMGSGDFCRVRFGIGKPTRKSMVEGYVLENFSSTEAESLFEATDKAAAALHDILFSDIQTAMQKYNRKEGANSEK
ncbi:MAG: aminoacyl-tRNA hydrolase [Syntrophales bacterium]|nr:aminoacyl-tRNA hydrolase [Syntrophales bacterium]